MNHEVISIQRSGGSTGQPLVPRRELSAGAYGAQQRETILHLFGKLDYDVARISVYCRERGWPSGHSEIQKVIRFKFWAVFGRRRADRLMDRRAA